MVIDEIVKGFEAQYPELTVGVFGRYKDGIAVIPIVRKTHESTMGYDYYSSDEGKTWQEISIPVKEWKGMKCTCVCPSVERVLEHIVDEALERCKSAEERKQYILDNAPNYLLEYLKLEVGKAMLRMYTR